MDTVPHDLSPRSTASHSSRSSARTNMASLARNALIRAAQVLADIGTEVVDSPLQQLASHARGRQLVAGEQPDLLCRANPIEHGLGGSFELSALSGGGTRAEVVFPTVPR